MKNSKDLGFLFHQYGSDKHVNGYTAVYHALFGRWRSLPITLLEIGIGTLIPGVKSSMVGYAQPWYQPGGSLRAWCDFFVHGTIHGVDVQPDTQFYDVPRITTHLCDSTRAASVHGLFENLSPVDIIIDDGSHDAHDQLATFTHFWPHLAPGGTYVIEDVWPGSPLLTTLLPALHQQIGQDGFMFAPCLLDHGEKRTPLLVVSRLS